MTEEMELMTAAAVDASCSWTDPDTGYTWRYRINGDTAEIYGTYNSSSDSYTPAISPEPTGAVTIPATLGGKPVTSIGDSAFSCCSGLTGVTIGSGVTSIGNDAFFWCIGLTSVKFEGDAPAVGDSALWEEDSGCTAYVHRDSTGWGVDIPGRWNGIDIAYW